VNPGPGVCAGWRLGGRGVTETARCWLAERTPGPVALFFTVGEGVGHPGRPLASWGRVWRGQQPPPGDPRPARPTLPTRPECVPCRCVRVIVTSWRCPTVPLASTVTASRRRSGPSMDCARSAARVETSSRVSSLHGPASSTASDVRRGSRWRPARRGRWFGGGLARECVPRGPVLVPWGNGLLRSRFSSRSAAVRRLTVIVRDCWYTSKRVVKEYSHAG